MSTGTISVPAFGGNGFGSVTAAAGTAITRMIPPRRNAFTRLMKTAYTAAATAHNLVAMRSLGRAKTVGTAAASQAVITLDVNPSPAGNTIAASDLVIIRKDDGNLLLGTVSSWNGTTKALTLAANLAVALSAGADVWMMGVAADTDPRTGEVHPTFTCAASATTTLEETTIGVLGTIDKDEPILLFSANGTNAGTLLHTVYSHTTK